MHYRFGNISVHLHKDKPKKNILEETLAERRIPIIAYAIITTKISIVLSSELWVYRERLLICKKVCR